MENMQNMGGKNMCKCPHHKVFPILIILFGLLFLLQAMNVLDTVFVMYAWPVLVIIAGVKKLFMNMCKCC